MRNKLLHRRRPEQSSLATAGVRARAVVARLGTVTRRIEPRLGWARGPAAPPILALFRRTHVHARAGARAPFPVERVRARSAHRAASRATPRRSYSLFSLNSARAPRADLPLRALRNSSRVDFPIDLGPRYFCRATLLSSFCLIGQAAMVGLFRR